MEEDVPIGQNLPGGQIFCVDIVLAEPQKYPASHSPAGSNNAT